MDILQEYERSQAATPPKNATPTQEQLLRQRYAPDAGFFVRVVMKLSGGRIQDTRRASVVLLIFAAIMIVVSLFLFFSGGAATSLQPNWAPYTGR